MTTVGELALEIMKGHIETIIPLLDRLRDEDRQRDYIMVRQAFGVLLSIYRKFSHNIPSHEDLAPDAHWIKAVEQIKTGTMLTLPKEIEYEPHSRRRTIESAYERFSYRLFELFYLDMVTLSEAIDYVNIIYPEDKRTHNQADIFS